MAVGMVVEAALDQVLLAVLVVVVMLIIIAAHQLLQDFKALMLTEVAVEITGHMATLVGRAVEQLHRLVLPKAKEHILVELVLLIQLVEH